GGGHGPRFLAPLPPLPPPGGTTADLILRRGDGTYQIYDIGNNAIVASYQLAQVGTDWTFVTLGGFSGGDTSDMLLRNSQTGGFQGYDIGNDINRGALPGTPRLGWQGPGSGNFEDPGEKEEYRR